MGQAGSTENTAKPRPKPEEKPLRVIYAAQLDEREDETKLLLPEEMQAAERLRLVGRPDPQDDAWKTYWEWRLSICEAGITRMATTLGELSQMRKYHPPLRIFTPSPSFLNSDAAQVYLGELRGCSVRDGGPVRKPQGPLRGSSTWVLRGGYARPGPRYTT